MHLGLPPDLLTMAAAGRDPVGYVVLGIAIILLVAKAGGEIALRLGQPPVLGELVVGVLLGNAARVGFTTLEPLKTDPFVDMFARLGVLILLFEVGLESTVAQMLKVGASSLLVAMLGVIAPFVLGWVVGARLLPDQSVYVHAFLGAALCATSIGITARVLADMGRSRTPEARVILGAAVIDDVLGLAILAVVSGVITSAEAGVPVSYGGIGLMLLKAVAFLAGSLALGVYLSPKLFFLASRLQSRGVLLVVGLGFCFLLSWASGAIGLAPIVGAFAAGLILEEVHYRDFTARGEHGLEVLIHPIVEFLAPVFFVLMGMRTELSAFAHPEVVLRSASA